MKELAQRRDAIFLEDVNSLPASLQSERSRLVLLDCQIFIPLPGRQHLIGWLALGERESGERYTERDIDFLVSLCDQAAVAIERAQVIRDLQRRVKEMDVLTRVAQGTNFTINFDDILELIYAQTSQVIKVDDFHVALLDPESEKMHYVFFLEKDERIPEFEGKEIILGQGLEAEIFRGRRPLLVDDYEPECWARGFVPDVRGLHAWMAVPLNTGGETIGLISLGSRSTDTVYQPEQLNLFQAMADQAAGAIVKARLLHVTEDRARQLATLNEIGRDLTSTLDLKPLLNRILTSAADILNCQAGSLFLVDEQTGELVFEVVIGPVAGDLIGKRLPPGKGVVGQAVETGQPVIANDAWRRKEWFNTDQQTGFTTQDLLAVPMRIKDHILGVIEVINKADGQPFNVSDQELLVTFASQAAIAIENARLYTMTDQALTVKVEELSVMQRIDRELNTSLEVNRAMNITLSWAMRQSGANAGLVGMIDSDGIRVVTAEGYASDADSDILPSNGNDVHYLDVQLPGISGALQTGQPTTVYKEATNGSFASLLIDAQGQVGIPIRREDEVIGILLLETQSTENFSDDVLAFLSRLGDHAAIAIANAQLYSEVREANLSKSKFVSFVAHELKNPMASIKGYTELIAGGMTGPVNEMQSSFLNTIRSNVDRMNTIVSDLNDLTKIQVGSLRLEFKSISVPEAVDEVARTLQKLLDEKRQTLSLDLPPDLPRIWAHPLRLSQILTNLVSNANKYTGEDGNILLSAEAWLPDEAAESNLRFVHIWVKDNGIGIGEEDQDKIFQQYFRTDISKETASGTGLGLNISKSLVEFQGGRIWFESKRNEGSTFHFTIPAAELN